MLYWEVDGDCTGFGKCPRMQPLPAGSLPPCGNAGGPEAGEALVPGEGTRGDPSVPETPYKSVHDLNHFGSKGISLTKESGAVKR